MKYRILSCCIIFWQLLLAFPVPAQTVFIPNNSTWKYWANTQANFPTGWQNTGFNDAAWPSGSGELGYGDGDETTCIPSGGGGTLCTPTGNKWPAYYFRRTVNIPDPSVFASFGFRVERDDGFVVYVNGAEVYRNNMPAGGVSYGTAASAAVEDAVIQFTVPVSAFAAGSNTIAVEMHQATVAGTPPVSTSSDISFNLELSGNDAFSANLLRGPYLQAGTMNSIVIRWRTNTAQDSRVEWGTSPGVFPFSVADGAAVTEHEIKINGLLTDTKYYYRIGNSGQMQAADNNQFFSTLPAADATRKIRVVAFGDCGRGNATFQDQNLSSYLNYLQAGGIDAADAWLLLGDNAYDFGTDNEFTTKFFDIYGGNMLENHKLYPAPGNHDYGNSAVNKQLRNMPYHLSFTVPKQGEAGGVASNKQNYYSFDIGNIHFLSLDSYGIESDLTDMQTSGSSALKTWLTADLAATTKKWIIAYWHHPPYTKGSHNSDSESDLVNIRQNFIGFLESRGVDLIVCGHSHNYERGYLIRNYTGNWASFNTGTHALSTSSATYTSAATCPYIYRSTPLNHGTVYVVAGSTGADGSMQAGFGTGPMPFALNDGAVFYFEVEDNRLDAKLLRRNGTVFDQFTMLKDVGNTTNYTIANGQSQRLEASWPGAYQWNTLANTRSIDVMPPDNSTTLYTVTDTYGCVTDQFSVTTSATLALRLQEFRAARKGAVVQLNASVFTDEGLDVLRLERSADGQVFQVLNEWIVREPGTGTRSFHWTDEAPLPGVSFYRLVHQKSHPYQQTVLGIRKVSAEAGLPDRLRVQPAGEGQVCLSLETQEAGPVTWQAAGPDGRVFRHQTWNLVAGRNIQTVALPPGICFFTWIRADGRRRTAKIMIPGFTP